MLRITILACNELRVETDGVVQLQVITIRLRRQRRQWRPARCSVRRPATRSHRGIGSDCPAARRTSCTASTWWERWVQDHTRSRLSAIRTVPCRRQNTRTNTGCSCQCRTCDRTSLTKSLRCAFIRCTVIWATNHLGDRRLGDIFGDKS